MHSNASPFMHITYRLKAASNERWLPVENNSKQIQMKNIVNDLNWTAQFEHFPDKRLRDGSLGGRRSVNRVYRVYSVNKTFSDKRSTQRVRWQGLSDFESCHKFLLKTTTAGLIESSGGQRILFEVILTDLPKANWGLYCNKRRSQGDLKAISRRVSHTISSPKAYDNG